MSKYYAVKCEKTVTFYINVFADNEWQAQHIAELRHREEDTFVGYNRLMSEIKTLHAVEIDNAED
jgi:hypothetical protein